MNDSHDLGDPDFEPSDAQLVELSVRAFSGVRAANEEALARLRAEIVKAREEALRALDERATHERDLP